MPDPYVILTVGDGIWVVFVIENQILTLFDIVTKLDCITACFIEEIHFKKVESYRKIVVGPVLMPASI